MPARSSKDSNRIVSSTRKFVHRGLRTFYQHAPGPLTSIALVVRAGARFDAAHPGIAHFAEHMLFQGTTSMDQRELNHRAADLGGEHNADTGYEMISMTFEVFNEDVEAALQLLADQYYNTEVTEDRVRKERRVVLDEVRGRMDDPIERLHTRAWTTFFGGALSHPIWGNIKSLKAIRAQDVSGYLARNFCHDKTVLGLVGGADWETIRRAVRRSFTGNTGTAGRIPAVRQGGKGRLLSRADNGQATLITMMQVAPDPRELVAVGLALDLVGADPDSRLFQEIRERLGLGYDVSASLDHGPDWAVATISASASRDAVDRLERAVNDTMRQAAEVGFGDDEMRRARKKLRYRYAYLAESRMDRALTLAEGSVAGFPLPEDSERIVAALTREDVEAAWRRTMASRTLTAILC